MATKDEKAVAEHLEAGRFSHAMLIEGAHSESADAAARRIAMTLLCRTGQGSRPCRECISCKKVVGDIHPDLLTYIGEGKSRAISVEKVREIRAAAFLMPNEGEKKVMLLKDTHTMLLPAQNALLKILEEPPESTVFILTANNRFRLLETVRSRVSVIALDGGRDLESTETGEHGEAVQSIIGHLDDGKEVLLLACLTRYEKDRAAFLDMLNELRTHLLGAMISGRSQAGGSQRSPAKHWALAEAVEQTINNAGHNVGVPLMICSLAAGLFEANEEWI